MGIIGYKNICFRGFTLSYDKIETPKNLSNSLYYTQSVTKLNDWLVQLSLLFILHFINTNDV